MAGYQYHGRPLGHSQYEDWRQSVHANALLKKGDLSAATCNNCHGNHGAVPPAVGSVANACGTCHGKIAGLFADTRMKHRFVEENLPGCATCHTATRSRHLGQNGGNGKRRRSASSATRPASMALLSPGPMPPKRSAAGSMDSTNKSPRRGDASQAERLGMEVSEPKL